MGTRLALTRAQVVARRLVVGALGARLPRDGASLRRAAWAGLQDSMPRAAVLSLHARVDDVAADDWEADGLVQLWGPRYSAYVVPEEDAAVFSLGRMPTARAARERAESVAARLDALLAGERMPYDDAGRALGVDPNRLRYGATTGTVRIRWDGARRPVVWTVEPPDVDADDARRELARRFLHVFGPTTAAAFARWAGVTAREAAALFDVLDDELLPVTTPVGDAWVLVADEDGFRAPDGPVAPARLLPSGDPFFLLWGPDRELLVADARHRDALWTSRVWPGAVLVGGEVVGTWRRTKHQVDVEPWRRLSASERGAVEAEAATLPLPDLDREVSVGWA